MLFEQYHWKKVRLGEALQIQGGWENLVILGWICMLTTVLAENSCFTRIDNLVLVAVESDGQRDTRQLPLQLACLLPLAFPFLEHVGPFSFSSQLEIVALFCS